MVLIQLIRENAATQYKSVDREAVAQDLLNVFYIQQCKWKNAIVSRGLEVFWTSYFQSMKE